MRELKALGFAVVAVLAAGALVSPAAQASGAAQFTANSYPASLSGFQEGNNVFKIGSGVREVECVTTSYTGSISAASTSVLLEPAYNGCTSKPGSIPATVTTNGCKFNLTATKTPQNLNATISCTIINKPHQIEIHIYENITKQKENRPLCTYDIPSQGPIAAGTWANMVQSHS